MNFSGVARATECNMYDVIVVFKMANEGPRPIGLQLVDLRICFSPTYFQTRSLAIHIPTLKFFSDPPLQTIFFWLRPPLKPHFFHAPPSNPTSPSPHYLIKNERSLGPIGGGEGVLSIPYPLILGLNIHYPVNFCGLYPQHWCSISRNLFFRYPVSR